MIPLTLTSEDVDRIEKQRDHMETMLRAIDAATDLETARRRANKGLSILSENVQSEATPTEPQ